MRTVLQAIEPSLAIDVPEPETEGKPVTKGLSPAVARSEHGLGRAVARLEAAGGAATLVVGSDFEPTLARLALANAVAGALDALHGLNGAATLALDVPADGGPRLTLAAETPDHVAIPGVMFLTGDFQLSPAADWSTLPARAHWRGELAGWAVNLNDVMKLKRMRLCVMARFSDRIDARLTGEGPFSVFGVNVLDVIRGLNLHVGPDDGLPAMRYALDVEGDPADAAKLALLLSRACVIRVGRPARVWYEKHLDDQAVFHVPEPEDVPAALSELEANGRGETLRQGGRRLVQSLDVAVARAALRSAAAEVFEKTR